MWLHPSQREDVEMQVQDESYNSEREFEKSVNPEIDQYVCTVIEKFPEKFPEKNDSRI
jgi:hypothetical protein